MALTDNAIAMYRKPMILLATAVLVGVPVLAWCLLGSDTGNGNNADSRGERNAVSTPANGSVPAGEQRPAPIKAHAATPDQPPPAAAPASPARTVPESTARLDGLPPAYINQDGAQVFEGVQCQIRQPDGTMKVTQASVSVKPAQVVPLLPAEGGVR